VARPRFGISVDLVENRLQVSRGYAQMVRRAGADAILLVPDTDGLETCLDVCDGFVLTGGDDPIMETWKVRTHPAARPVDPDRQRFELALLDALDSRPEVPVLGICLGMQLMALHAGGRLDQYLPDTLATADHHWGHVEHEVEGGLGRGTRDRRRASTGRSAGT
jgi:putative glutamine amidotransferase